ncbi:hypothetical protein HYU23_03535 [Candidatus Woesearchaeota archaeon]|nr:hypothetical protein [Candidatus Woesearchaeota archaeon]
MKKIFAKREEINLLISILVLTFVFGFDDGSKIFVLTNWLLNLIKIFFLVVIAILFRELIIKYFAKRHDATSEYELWRMKKMWFGGGNLTKGFPFGIILALIFTIFSQGKLFFTAIGIHSLTEYKIARLGRKHPTLNYFEEAQIASAGIISSLFLAVAGLLIGRIFGINMNYFVNINFFIALFNMLPFSNLDGAKIFFGSLIMYIFVLVFIIVGFIIIKFTIFFGLILAFLAACIAAFIYFYKINF